MDADEPEPTRQDVDGMPGPVLLEFGTGWCAHCQALAPHLKSTLTKHTGVRFIHVEDGKGKPLGRSFRVKLWPTLVFMRDGQIVWELVRPSPGEVEKALDEVDGSRS